MRIGIVARFALAAIAIGALWLIVASTGTALATSKGDSMPPSSFYAVTLEGGAELADVPIEDRSQDRQDGPGDGAAALLTLSGFLGLIAGNLLRWSGGRG